jgi:class 3 adenylate cyclase/DNA-binding response OmpR family regulator
MPTRRIRVLLSDDNLIVREGVRSLLAAEPDLEVVGVTADYDGLLAEADRTRPQVVVTDIRMPPTFQREGIDAAKEIRKRDPGTGVVILSQYREPEYAIALLSEGSDGYAYLLKDHVAEGRYLVQAVREVATGGSMIDPGIAQAILSPVTQASALTSADLELLRMLAEGRPLAVMASARKLTPAELSEATEEVLLKLAHDASAGVEGSLRRLRLLHQAIVEREQHGQTLSRLLPGGVAERLLREGWRIGQTEKLLATVVISDVRGYSTIAERSDPAVLAAQLGDHRSEMTAAILAESGTVMAFMGDAVMAVFAAPLAPDDHADRGLAATRGMQAAQARLNSRWEEEGLSAFGIGTGISTGEVAAALLGSEERLEYTVVGDIVNLAQRLQGWAAAGEIVLSEATRAALRSPPEAEPLEPALVKGRTTPVQAYRLQA